MRGLILRLVHQDEGSAGDRPGGFTRLVGQDFIETLAPVCVAGGGSEGQVVRQNELLVFVLHCRESHLVLFGVSIFHVTNRARHAAHESGNAFVPFTTHASGPLHSGAFTDFLLPLSRHFGEVVGENKGRARTVSAAHHTNRLVGQVQRRIQLLDRLVIPVSDLAQVNVCQHRAGQLHFTRLDPCNIDHRHDATDRSGELHQTVFSQRFGRQGHV